MKKFYSIISLAVFSIAAFVSCNREMGTPDEPKIEFTVNASDEVENPGATKTYAWEETVDSKTVTHVNWTVGEDKVKVFESVDDTFLNSAESSAATSEDGGSTASFAVTLTGEAAGSSYSYIAAYPSTCIDKSNDFYRVCIPASQTLRGTGNNNLAANADVLISNPVVRDTRISSGESLSYNFKRFGTTVKMTLKGITSTEKISKVELTAPTGIVGYTRINLATGELEENPYYTTKKVTLTVPDLVATGADAVWFRVLSGTWNASESNPIEVRVTTDKATYSKTINSTAKPLEFAEGGLTTFGINGMNRQLLPAVPDGDYVIASYYTTDEKYYAMSNVATGARLSQVDITDGFNASSYTGSDYDIVWTLTTTESGTAIQTLDGAYLQSADRSASTSNDAAYYSISKDDTDNTKYNIVPKVLSSYKLMQNANQNYFAFYSSNPSVSMIAALYLIPAEVDKTPVIILDEESASVAGNTASFDITFTKRFLTGPVTASVVSDPDGVISGDPIVGTGKVTVNLNANTTSEDKEATIKVCSASDEIEEIFTLTLRKYQATSKDEISSTTAGHTSSSYTSWSNKSKNTANSGITSDAVYAGKTAYSTTYNNSLQMNSNSGYAVWTTTSGGLVTSVSVDFANANGKTIAVYGKNTAFNGDGTSGATKIGDLSSTNTKVTATADYEFIMLKASGATYVNKFVVEWKAKAAATGITVKTAPTKTEYHVGDAFDPTGLVVNVTYDDGSDEDVTYGPTNASQFTFAPALDVVGGLQPSNTAVTITYKNQPTTQDINVYTWTYNSLVIANAPTKTTYWAGETFNKSGMVVNAHYVDNKPETPNTKDEEVTDYTFSTDPLTAGTTSITLRKTINAVTKTANQEITVNARPVFTVESSGSADPVIVSNVGTNQEGLVVASVTASENLAWTASITAGDEDEIILNTANGVGSGDISIDCLANERSAKNWTITVSTVVAGVLTSSYDIHVQQEAGEGEHSVQLAKPSKPTYDNSTKTVSWTAVTKDINGDNLVDYTPTYEVSVDNGVWESATSPYSVSSLSVASHTIKVRAIGNGTTYDTSDDSEVLEFTITNPQWKLVTDASTLKSGDKITFYVNKTYTYSKKQYTAYHVIGSCNGSNLAGVDCKDKVNQDGTVISDLPSNGAYFTLGGNASDGWTLKLSSDNKYLYVSAKNKVATQDDATTWSISVDGSTKEVMVTQNALTGSDAGNYYIQWQWNTATPYFSAYKTAQTKVKMFRLE